MFYNCKSDELDFVLYDDKPHTVEELTKDFGIQADIQPTVDPDKNLLFVSLDEMILTNLGLFKKTTLSKLNFNSFNELENEHFLIEDKKSKLSASKRQMVEQVYSDIAKMFNE